MEPSENELKCIAYAHQFYPRKNKTLWERFFPKKEVITIPAVSPNKSFVQL